MDITQITAVIGAAASLLCTLVVGALTYFFKKTLTSLEDADKKNAADIQTEARKREQERREEELLHPKAKQKKPETAPKEKKPPTTEAGRVGERPYARGRSYQENRYEQE